MLEKSITLALFAQFFSAVSLAAVSITQPATATLQFLSISKSTGLWGVQTGGATPCHLQISVIDGDSEFVMLSLPVTDAVTISSVSKGAISRTSSILAMVNDNDIPLSIPEIGIPLGTKHEHIVMEVSRSGSVIHVDAERKISGITIGDHNISISCDFMQN